MPDYIIRQRDRGRGQNLEAEAEAKILASRPFWPRGLNITECKSIEAAQLDELPDMWISQTRPPDDSLRETLSDSLTSSRAVLSRKK